MRSIESRVALRYKIAADELWLLAEADLRTFNDRYDEAQKLKEPLSEADQKLLNNFAFRKNGTAPSFPDAWFWKWMGLCFSPMDIDDPDAVRPQGVMILEVVDGKRPLKDFLQQLDAYRDALQGVVNATAPAMFTYQGFKVENKQHMGDAFCRRMLEGVDYVVALFKRRGLTTLLNEGLSKVELVPEISDGSNTLGLYWNQSKTITLSGRFVGMGTGRFMKWANEVFLHEFGHHVHLSFLATEAKKAWDSGWAEVQEKKEVIELAFKKITREERVVFYNTLKATNWDVGRAAKKLDPVQRVKFGVWLRTPMTGSPLITDKQFRLTKDGQYIAGYMQNPEGFMKKNYDLTPGEPDYDTKNQQVAKRVADKLGLLYAGAYPIPAATVEELAKADPAMQKTVDEALAKLEIVSPYGKTNEKEDFAETFVAFVGAPEKLTPTAKFRMQQALSLSGLYGKQVMKLAKAVHEAVKSTRRFTLSAPAS